ncbi:hypothetical protein U14_01059 [Candidatus Moduliflexus flocculans]|uniref:Uncharacterized protein n=1 Tax=Candidatus Moduliflexus flocculans TaxID=1499966 RepID=A0A0S6VRB8_9BACT|nr:hypothetical protein U14_01059 [Candidatus Moduliflexus flocculans]
MRNGDERLAVEMKRRFAVCVSFRHAHPLLLVIKQFDIHALQRQRGFDVGREHGHVVQGAFRDQANVRHKHVARDRAAAVVIGHVIRLVAGIVAVIVAFVPAVIHALFVIIPRTAIFDASVPRIRDFRQHDFLVFRRVRTLIDHVRALERERQRVHAAREILDERCQIETVPHPAILLFGFKIEINHLLPDHAPDPAQFAVASAV